MKLSRKWSYGLLGSAALLTVALSTVAFVPQVAQAADSALTGLGWGGLGRGGQGQEELAKALGITVEELQAAQDEVFAADLAAAVAAGEITQEDADTMLAQQKLHRYLADRMQTAYTEAVQDAVTAGIITQDQADTFLNDGIGMGMGMWGGFGREMMGGRGMGHHRGMGFGWDDEGRGMGRGMGPRGWNGQPTATPESSSTN